ncbi:MAG: hypothetical protein JWM36_617, partial [Hyphomicrobiales bacterium]|nr:hypothetical protein [Hyphomicrobiales bacterium]
RMVDFSVSRNDRSPVSSSAHLHVGKPQRADKFVPIALPDGATNFPAPASDAMSAGLKPRGQHKNVPESDGETVMLLRGLAFGIPLSCKMWLLLFAAVHRMVSPASVPQKMASAVAAEGNGRHDE